MRLKTRHRYITILAAVLTVLAWACSSNNCPLNNTVTCNYYFYDSNGKAISLLDTLTVSIMLQGHDTIFQYRYTGMPHINSKVRIDSLLEKGYKEVKIVTRHDSVLVNKSAKTATLKLPMAYFLAADTIIFDYASLSNNDTLCIEHDNMPHVELPECGSYMFHRITNAKSTEAAIEKIEIANPTVDYEGNENIKIYFAGTVE